MSEVQKEKDYYVYTHSTEERGIFYVGKGTKDRIKSIYRKHNNHHTNIVNKYGAENIIVRSMLCRSEQRALELEVRLITALRNGGVNLANLTNGGEGGSGYNHTEEAKLKIAVAMKGKLKSDETKIKMIESRKGRDISDECRKKMAASRKGYTHSDETKAKQSESAKGKRHSDETKAKLSAINIGKTMSDESRLKMSNAQKGKFVSDETRAKLVLAWEKRKLNKIIQQ